MRIASSYSRRDLMSFEQQDERPQKGEPSRREFLSALTTAAGLLALGLSPGASVAERQSSGKHEPGKCLETPSCEPREGLYQIHQLSEQALLQTYTRSEEHTSELQSLRHLVCRLL